MIQRRQFYEWWEMKQIEKETRYDNIENTREKIRRYEHFVGLKYSANQQFDMEFGHPESHAWHPGCAICPWSENREQCCIATFISENHLETIRCVDNSWWFLTVSRGFSWFVMLDGSHISSNTTWIVSWDFSQIYDNTLHHPFIRHKQVQLQQSPRGLAQDVIAQGPISVCSKILPQHPHILFLCAHNNVWSLNHFVLHM